MKFGQFMEHYKRKVFIKKSYEKYDLETSYRRKPLSSDNFKISLVTGPF